MQPPELKAAQVHRPFPPERYLPYLTTNEVAALPKQDAAVIVVVAAIEQHGPHLPIAHRSDPRRVAADARPGTRGARDAAAGCCRRSPMAAATSTRRSPARMTLSQATLGTVIHELAESVARAGFRRLVLFNSHGGNAPVLDYLARDVREATGLMVFHLAMFRTGLAYPQISEQEAALGHARRRVGDVDDAVADARARADGPARGQGRPRALRGARRSTSTCRCSDR